VRSEARCVQIDTMLKEEVHTDSDASDVSDEQEWLDQDDDEGDEESVQVISLLDDRVFPDAMSMVSYCREKYGFDFLAVRDRLQLDFHGTVKFINFSELRAHFRRTLASYLTIVPVRQRVHEGLTLPDEITLKDIDDDRYLKPVLDDDALIMCLDDLPEPSPPAGEAAKLSEVSPEDVIKRNSELQTELEALAKQFNNYRLAVQQTLDTRWGEDDAETSSKGPSTPQKAQESTVVTKPDNDYSESYFASYARNGIFATYRVSPRHHSLLNLAID
jgi:hypothetical protein